VNDTPILDAEGLQRLGDAPFVCKMIDTFLDYVPGKVAEVRAAFEAGDLAAAGRAAHPIKSSARYLGAPSLRDLAAQIEQLAGEQKRDAVAVLLPDFEATYQRVATALQAKRAELTSLPAGPPPAGP
jgi:HPt (histidine-containing phosphotransfer) domain-containing protein